MQKTSITSLLKCARNLGPAPGQSQSLASLRFCCGWQILDSYANTHPFPSTLVDFRKCAAFVRMAREESPVICMCTGVWPSALYTVEAAGGMPAVHLPHGMTSELCSPAGAVTCSLMCICCFCEIVLACCLRMSLFIITAYTGAFPYVLASSLSAFLKHLLPLINQSLRSVRFRGTIEVLRCTHILMELGHFIVKSTH